MGVVMSSFPLLNLPSKAQIIVLRNMGPFQQMGFSILSDKTKNLVKSLNLDTYGLYVSIGRTVEINIWLERKFIRLYFYSDGNGDGGVRIADPPMKFGISNTCYMHYEEDGQEVKQKWEKKGFTLRNWIDHFNTVLNKSKIHKFSFDGILEQYDFKSLRETIQGFPVESLVLNFVEFEKYAKMIVACFQSCDELEIFEGPFESIKKVLMANYNALCLTRSEQLTLDDLLICNNLGLFVYASDSLSDKDLNRFLKHWMNGSNRRTEYIRIVFENDRHLDQTIILKGLHYKVVPKGQKRIVRRRDDMEIYEGGFDIWRNDGTLGNVKLEWDANDENYVFELKIWHEIIFEQVNC